MFLLKRMARYKNQPTNRQFIIAFLVAILFTQLQLAYPLKAQDFDSPEYKPVRFDCSQSSFVWEGQELTIGNKIGAGVEGSVYELLTGADLHSGKVLKMIFTQDAEYLYRKALEEVKLHEELPLSYIPTYYKNIYDFSQSQDQVIYGAFLIKERVYGYTAEEVISRPSAFKSIKNGYQAFREFRKQLREELITLAQRDVYVWDLHYQNIMFDVFDHKWVLIDAAREVTASGFERRLEELLPNADATHPIHGIYRMLTMRHTMTHEEVVDYIMNAYFRPLELRLRKLASGFEGSL